MTAKPAFPALGAPMSPAWVHGSHHVEDLALPKSVESGKLSLNKVGIGRMSVERPVWPVYLSPIDRSDEKGVEIVWVFPRNFFSDQIAALFRSRPIFSENIDGCRGQIFSCRKSNRIATRGRPRVTIASIGNDTCVQPSRLRHT
jgi:hypothetical protein